ncbi:O-antigen ligase family protein [Flavobacteriaceae bacterium]|nr:O-antigen ligase family protein [Flavobacteriaceae bacterium]
MNNIKNKPINQLLLFIVISLIIVLITTTFKADFLRVPLMILHIIGTFIFRGSFSKPDSIVYVLVIFFVYFIFQNLYLQTTSLAFLQSLILTVLYLLFYIYLKNVTIGGIERKNLKTISKSLFLLILFFFISPSVSLISGRYSGVFSNPNVTAHTALNIFPIILLGFNKTNKIFVSFVVLGLIIFLGSRSSLVAFLLGFIVLFISMMFKKGLNFFYSLIVMSLVLYSSWNVIEITANSTDYLSLIFNEKNHLLYQGSNGRDELFDLSLKKWEESPVLGSGFYNSKIEYKNKEFSSHNSVYELLIKTGILGTILWLTLFLVIMYKICRSSNKWEKSLGLMSMAIILSLCSNSSIFFVFNYYWYYFSIIFIISQSRIKNKETITVANADLTL